MRTQSSTGRTDANTGGRRVKGTTKRKDRQHHVRMYSEDTGHWWSPMPVGPSTRRHCNKKGAGSSGNVTQFGLWMYSRSRHRSVPCAGATPLGSSWTRGRCRRRERSISSTSGRCRSTTQFPSRRHTTEDINFSEYVGWLVAKDINIYNAPELFAATPPIVSLNYLMLRAAQGRQLSITHVDDTLACFYVDPSRHIYVKRPVEDQGIGEGDMCGKLREAMGRAAQRNIGKLSAQRRPKREDPMPARPPHATFSPTAWNLCGLAQGGDFEFVGLGQHLDATANHMGHKFRVKVALMGPHDQGGLRALIRSICWTSEGWFASVTTSAMTSWWRSCN